MREPFESALVGDDDDEPDGNNEPSHFSQTDTTPLEVVEEVYEDEDFEDEDEDDESYFFRRHWREPVLRLIPSPYTIRGYMVVALLGVVAILVGGFFLFFGGATAQASSTVLCIFGVIVGVLLMAYPVTREVYRWRKRQVHIFKENGSVKVLYREPDNILLLFNGDGDGNVTTLEGSTEINIEISWPNRLFFWGCGNMLIAGKVEGGAPVIRNVPHVRQVRAFMSGRM